MTIQTELIEMVFANEKREHQIQPSCGCWNDGVVGGKRYISKLVNGKHCHQRIGFNKRTLEI